MVSGLKQMLNCCIERKKARDDARKVLDEGKGGGHRVSGSSTKEASPGKSWDSWSDSEEEFFECLSDQGEMEAPQTEEGTKSRRKAEGRLHQHNSMTLLHSSEALYVPLTQVSICLSAFHSRSLTHPLCLSTPRKRRHLCCVLMLTSNSPWLEFILEWAGSNSVIVSTTTQPTSKSETKINRIMKIGMKVFRKSVSNVMRGTFEG